MLKTVVPQQTKDSASASQWIDLSSARVEISSEDAAHPIENALLGADDIGWRAGQAGDQRICIVFDEPRDISRIVVSFSETETSRTQEFVLRWCPPGENLRDIVRQQWNFDPSGSTSEVEDYHLQLKSVSKLELNIKPDITGAHAHASLKSLRVA